MILMIPISYIALKAGAVPEIVFLVQLLVTFAAQIVMLLIIRPLIQLSLRKYVTEVFVRAGIVSLLAAIPSYIVFRVLPVNFWTLLVVCATSVVFSALFIYFIGLNKSEKQMVSSYLKPLLSRLHR